MLTVFFDYRGIVHSEFVPTGQIVNKEYYLGIMRRLRESIDEKYRICGRTTVGFCIMTTRHRTQQHYS